MQITVNQEKLAEILGGISKKTLQNRLPSLYRQGLPRPLPLGGTAVWRLVDIEAWLERLATTPAPAPAEEAPVKRGRGRPRKEDTFVEGGAA